MKDMGKKCVAGIAASALAVSMIALPQPGILSDNNEGSVAYAESTVSTHRIWGEKAADTSYAIAKEAFPNGCKAAVIARSDDYYDAMSASGLAGVLDAPILLTPSDQLSSTVADAIKSLGVEEVYIVGGTAAISSEVEQSLSKIATVKARLWGNYACDTSIACAKMIEELGGNEKGEAIVATSSSFMDAVSISSYAYKYKVPMIIETPNYNYDGGLPSGSDEFLQDASRILVVGGPAAVPYSVVEDRYGWNKTLRMFGEIGYDTSAAIAETLTSEGSLGTSVVGVATGEEASKGVDALAAASLCAKNDAAVLLANQTGDCSTVSKYMVSNQDELTAGLFFGGNEALSDDVYNYARKIIDGSFRYIALIGSDEWQPAGYSWHLEGSDLQMLLCVDSEAGNVYAVTIPRDTYYECGYDASVGHNARKSNYAYSLAYKAAKSAGKSYEECVAAGGEAVCDMMESLTGVGVDDYAVINLNEFGTLVDQLGGVDMFVPYSITYDFYKMTYTATGASQPPFASIYFNSGNQTLGGLQSSSLARARTGYANYGLEQDATRQAVCRQMLLSLMRDAFSTSNAASFVQAFVDSNLIHTNLTAQDVADWVAPLQQKTSFTFYGTSSPVNGWIMEFPDDAPYLIDVDDLFFWNIMNTVRRGESTNWLGQYYGVYYDSWYPICTESVVYPAH